MRRLEKFGYARVSLVITLAVVLAVIASRYYYSSFTGFLNPDEAYYYNTYVLDQNGIRFLGYRDVYLATLLLFFGDVRNAWQFFQRGFLYSSLCAIGAVVPGYLIVRRLELDQKISGLLILSLPMFAVFLFLAATMLTEPTGPLFGMVALYFTLRHAHTRGGDL